MFVKGLPAPPNVSNNIKAGCWERLEFKVIFWLWLRDSVAQNSSVGVTRSVVARSLVEGVALSGRSNLKNGSS